MHISLWACTRGTCLSPSPGSGKPARRPSARLRGPLFHQLQRAGPGAGPTASQQCRVGHLPSRAPGLCVVLWSPNRHPIRAIRLLTGRHAPGRQSVQQPQGRRPPGASTKHWFSVRQPLEGGVFKAKKMAGLAQGAPRCLGCTLFVLMGLMCLLRRVQN